MEEIEKNQPVRFSLLSFSSDENFLSVAAAAPLIPSPAAAAKEAIQARTAAAAAEQHFLRACFAKRASC